MRRRRRQQVLLALRRSVRSEYPADSACCRLTDVVVIWLVQPCRCRARVVELPCSCHICGLTLVSSPHLARSYHHLFPVRAFSEVPQAELEAVKAVSGTASDCHPVLSSEYLLGAGLTAN